MPGHGIRLLATGLLATCGAGMLTLTAMMNPAFAHADGEDIGLVIGASGVPIPGALYVAADRILEAVRQRSDVEVTPELMAFTEARLSDEVLGVHEEYLDTARRTIDENFGSLDGYLRSAGITEADVTQLRRALLG